MKVQAGSAGPIGQPDDAMAGGGLDPVARRILGAEDGLSDRSVRLQPDQHQEDETQGTQS